MIRTDAFRGRRRPVRRHRRRGRRARSTTSLAGGAGRSPRARDGDGVSATMHALYHGQPAIAEPSRGPAGARHLRGGGARPGWIGCASCSPPIRRSPRARIAGRLHGAPLPGVLRPGRRRRGDRALLAAGADVNARSDNDFAVLPIHSAVAGGHDDVVAVLVDAGADVERPPAPRLDAAPRRRPERIARVGRAAARGGRRSRRPRTTTGSRPLDLAAAARPRRDRRRCWSGGS